MSHAAAKAVWDIRGISLTQKVVLLCLADHADQDMRCFPSLARIADQTCMSPRAAWQALRELEKAGLIKTEGRGRNQSNVYTLDLAANANEPGARNAADAIAPRADREPDAIAPDASNAPDARGLRTSFQGASHLAHEGIAGRANEPVIEPVNEPVKRTICAPGLTPQARPVVQPAPPPALRPTEQRNLLPDEPFREARKTREPKADAPTPSALTWAAYAGAFAQRHGTEPTRNARVNAQIAQFVGRVPAEEAPQIAAFYVRHPAAYYVAQMHSVGLLLRDAEKLRAEWRRGQTVTMTEARQREQTSSNAAFRELERRRLAREAAAAPQEIPLRVEDDNGNR